VFVRETEVEGFYVGAIERTVDFECLKGGYRWFEGVNPTIFALSGCEQRK
jgi:hypothetical protein